MMIAKKNRDIKGFTLVEVVVSLGVVVVLLTGFFILFSQSQSSLNQSKSREVAHHIIIDTLKQRLNSTENVILEEAGEEVSKKEKGIERAFNWLINSEASLAGAADNNRDNAILIYRYKSKLGAANSALAVEGVDYVIATGASQLGEEITATKVAPGILVGKLYIARLSQYQFNSENHLQAREPAAEVVLTNGETVTDFANFTDSSLKLRVRIYALPNANVTFLKNSKIEWKDLGRPIIDIPIVVNY